MALEDYIKFQKDSFRLAKNKELIQKAIEKEDVVTTKLNKEKKKLKELEASLNEELSKRISIDEYLKNGAEGAARAENLQRARIANATAEFEKQQTAVRILSVEYNNIEERIRNYSKTASSLESDIEGKYIPATEKQTTSIKDNTTALDENAKKYEEVGSLKLLNQEEHIKTSLDLLKEQVDAEALINKDARDKDLAADKQAALDKVQLENDLRSKKLQMAASAFDALGALAGAFSAKNETDARKQFKVQKAFNIASAITNTALAVTGALTAGGNPIKLATGMQFVEAGIAAVSGAAAVANISKTQFNGGGTDTAPTPPTGGGGVSAPNFNIVGNSGINQLAELGGQPIQAYVVSGEVTSAQALDRNRVQNATF